jgi:hemerythrin superfamily protein
MSAEVEQVIFEKVKSLAPEQQQEVLEFVNRLQRESASAEDTPPAESNLKTLWEEIDEIVSDVPPEVWEQVPPDGSLNHDHYLYGASKKQ